MLATPSVFGVVCLGRRKKDDQAEALASQCEKP